MDAAESFLFLVFRNSYDPESRNTSFGKNNCFCLLLTLALRRHTKLVHCYFNAGLYRYETVVLFYRTDRLKSTFLSNQHIPSFQCCNALLCMNRHIPKHLVYTVHGKSPKRQCMLMVINTDSSNWTAQHDHSHNASTSQHENNNEQVCNLRNCKVQK